MIIKKKDLTEIIDTNGELIGSDAIPSNGSDLESRASNTTDYNANISHQPFKYDMLGRFGFTLMPFMESKETESLNVDNVCKLMHETFMTTLEYYYRHPNKLKSDYRLLSNNKSSKEREGVEERWGNEMIKIIKPFVENNSTKIEESTIHEDKMINKKVEDEIAKKDDDREIKDKKLEKVADLIGKLNKNDIDKLINILERK